MGYTSYRIQSIVNGAYRWRLGPSENWEFTPIEGASDEVQPGPLGEPTVRVASGAIGELVLRKGEGNSDQIVQLFLLLASILLTSWAYSDRKKQES